MSRMSDNVNNEKNFRNIENEDLHSSTKIPGNTLDYYNDDLSRNVVQGLFSGTEKKDKGSFVAGYDDEDFEAPQPRRKSRQLEPLNRTADMPPEKIKARRDDRVRDDRVRDDRTRDDRTRDDRTRDDRARDIRTRDEERPPVRSKDKENDDVDYNRYRSRDRFGERSPQESPPPQSRGVKPAISVNDMEKRAPYTTFKKDPYRAGSVQENDLDEPSAYHEDSMSLMKIIAISAAVVVLIILAALIFKINSTNNKLEQATKRLEEYEASESDVNQLKMEKEALESTNRLLTEELEEYKAALVSNTDPGGSDSEEAPSASAGAGVGTGTAGNRTYTVKSGDNLSKISTEFYGTVREVDKIKAANSMQSNDIRVGQVLIIP